VETDMIDRQLLHALVVEPRASFRALADVLGVSDQTVARHYRRLSESMHLRVHGLIRAPLVGWVDWMVRLQTTPGGAGTIAEALARRPDTRWVRLYSGGTEVVCSLQARTAEQRNTLFLHGLPGSRRVVQITAQSVLHVFSPVAWSVTARALSAAQLAKLDRGADREHSDGAAARLRPEDEPLLRALAFDGRTTNADLATQTHWHESTVRRRIEELRCSGLLYFDVDCDESMFGLSLTTMIWLSVEAAHLETVGRMLATHPEVPFAAATTGTTNLVVSATFRDSGHLYDYLTGSLAALPGVRSVETSPVIRTIKRAGVVHDAALL
jgi:DNA-binding Lrp family transcriptional regulator